MNKQELVEQISARTGLPKSKAECALNATLDTITQALKSGDKVQLIGFGAFEVACREARPGKNPRTKESILLPACNVVKFRPGTALKQSVQ